VISDSSSPAAQHRIDRCSGVRHAEDDLQKALEKVIDRLKAKDYQAVANLGYGDVSSAYVFLQRVMGGMQMNALKKSALISDIAGEATECVGSNLAVKPFMPVSGNSRSKPLYSVQTKSQGDFSDRT